MRCHYCNAVGATKRCAGCKQVYYCSVKCQKSNWKQHKLQCNPKDFKCTLNIIDDGYGGETVICPEPIPKGFVVFSYSKKYLYEVENHRLTKEQRRYAVGGLRANLTLVMHEDADIRLVNDNIDLAVLRDAARNNDYPAFIRECYARPVNTVIGIYVVDNCHDGVRLVTTQDIPANSPIVCSYGVGYWVEQFAHGICTDDNVSIWNAQCWSIHGGDEDAVNALNECIAKDPVIPKDEIKALEAVFPSFLDPSKHVVYSLNRNTGREPQAVCIDKSVMDRDGTVAEKIIDSIQYRVMNMEKKKDNPELMNAIVRDIALWSPLTEEEIHTMAAKL